MGAFVAHRRLRIAARRVRSGRGEIVQIALGESRIDGLRRKNTIADLEQRRPFTPPAPNDHNFGSLIMLSVTAGAFLLVTWVATKGLFFFIQESAIRWRLLLKFSLDFFGSDIGVLSILKWVLATRKVPSIGDVRSSERFMLFDPSLSTGGSRLFFVGGTSDH
jgi:hypothetical protein